MPRSSKSYLEIEYGFTPAEADRIAKNIRKRVKHDLAAGRFVDLDTLSRRNPAQSGPPAKTGRQVKR